MAPTEWNRTAEDRWLLRAAWLVLHPSFPSASVCTWISALGPLHLDLCAQGLAALCSNHGVVRGGMKLLGSLASAGLISLSFLLTAKAQVEPSFPAQCFAIGDSVILQSTGEHVLEQRLVRFTPTRADHSRWVDRHHPCHCRPAGGGRRSPKWPRRSARPDA